MMVTGRGGGWLLPLTKATARTDVYVCMGVCVCVCMCVCVCVWVCMGVYGCVCMCMGVCVCVCVCVCGCAWLMTSYDITMIHKYTVQSSDPIQHSCVMLLLTIT